MYTCAYLHISSQHHSAMLIFVLSLIKAMCVCVCHLCPHILESDLPTLVMAWGQFNYLVIWTHCQHILCQFSLLVHLCSCWLSVSFSLPLLLIVQHDLSLKFNQIALLTEQQTTAYSAKEKTHTKTIGIWHRKKTIIVLCCLSLNLTLILFVSFSS